jgi:hypothetical protein
MKAPIITVLLFLLTLSSCKDSNTTQNNSNKDSISKKDINIEERDNSNTYSKGTLNNNHF